MESFVMKLVAYSFSTSSMGSSSTSAIEMPLFPFLVQVGADFLHEVDGDSGNPSRSFIVQTKPIILLPDYPAICWKPIDSGLISILRMGMRRIISLRFIAVKKLMHCRI